MFPYLASAFAAAGLFLENKTLPVSCHP